MKITLLSILLTGVFLTLQLKAQSFSGGSGDGYASALSILQAGSQTGYYQGGAGGGFASNVSLTFSGSYDKFYGGDGDGYASVETMNFSFTPAKFQGSIGDGYSTAYSPVVKFQSAFVAAMHQTITPQRTKDYFAHTEEAFRNWTAYPNPFKEDIHLEISLATESQLGFELYDMMGRILLTQSHHLPMGTHELLLKPGPLPAGSYMLLMRKQSISGKQEAESLRLIRAPSTY